MHQSVLDLVDGSLALSRDLLKSSPHQQRASDMVALDSCFAALALLDAGQLLDFAVILLDLPTKGARLLCVLGRITSQVVGHNQFRAVRRHRNPEEFHFVVFGKAAHLDQLAAFEFLFAPLQIRHMAIRLRSTAVVDHAVAFERTIDLLQKSD